MSNAERYSSPVIIVSIITSNEVLAKTVEQSNLSQVEPFKDSPMPEESAIKWLKENIKVNAKDKMIYLFLKGTLDPEILQRTLQTNIQIVLKDNKDKIIQEIA